MIEVLNHGHVRLIESMGNDNSIVQMARVSYGEGTKKPSDDRTLIRYLIRNKHTSPLEGVIFKFHMKMPIFVARQIVRHRTASINEISARYSELKDEYYLPELERICEQSKSNKQGSGAILDEESRQKIQCKMINEHAASTQMYHNYLDTGVSREIARINLPLSTYTEWYWVMSLHNLFHFLKLRMDPHAQWECQQYANAIFELIKPIVPVACEAFSDYILNAVTFSANEMKVIRATIKDWKERCPIPCDLTWEDFGAEKPSKREIDEFKKKINI